MEFKSAVNKLFSELLGLGGLVDYFLPDIKKLSCRCEIISQITSGGMGSIYRAYDTLIQWDVAVEVISDISLSKESKSRLLREARVAGKLNHANIVTIYDVGEEVGQTYIVMELVEGETLYSQPQNLWRGLSLLFSRSVLSSHMRMVKKSSTAILYQRM